MSQYNFNNKKIVITRPEERSKYMVSIIEKYQGIPIVVPTLELQTVHSEELKYIANNICVYTCTNVRTYTHIYTYVMCMFT